MKDEKIERIESKALRYVPKWIWGFAGILIVLSVTLLANGIHVGTIVNNLVDIYIEQKKDKLDPNRHNNCQIDLTEIKREIEFLKSQSHPRG